MSDKVKLTDTPKTEKLNESWYKEPIATSDIKQTPPPPPAPKKKD